MALGAEARGQGKAAVEEEEGEEGDLAEAVITVEANISTIASTTGGVLMRRNSTLQARQSSAASDYVVLVQGQRFRCSCIDSFSAR